MRQRKTELRLCLFYFHGAMSMSRKDIARAKKGDSMSQNVFGKIIASNFFATTKGGKKRIDLTVLVNNPQNFWERS